MISIHLNLFRFVLWPRIWSILVYVPCTLENNMHSAVVGVLCTCQSDPVGWWWYWVLSSCLITYWEGVLKSSTTIVYLSISPFSYIRFCFTYFAVLLLGATQVELYIFLMSWPFNHCIISLSVSSNFIYSEVYFTCY